MTGKRPFETHTLPGDVVLAIERGELPAARIPEQLANDKPCWKPLQRCWSPLMEDRPSITEIVEVIYSPTDVRPDDADPDDPLWRVVRPPANETPAQTVLRKQQELEATRVSKSIDESILKESVQIKKHPIVKILLLGELFSPIAFANGPLICVRVQVNPNLGSPLSSNSSRSSIPRTRLRKSV